MPLAGPTFPRLFARPFIAYAITADLWDVPKSSTLDDPKYSEIDSWGVEIKIAEIKKKKEMRKAQAELKEVRHTCPLIGRWLEQVQNRAIQR